MVSRLTPDEYVARENAYYYSGGEPMKAMQARPFYSLQTTNPEQDQLIKFGLILIGIIAVVAIIALTTSKR